MGKRGHPDGPRWAGLHAVGEGVKEFVFEFVAEAALYAIACGVLAAVGLGFAFYPRETAAVVGGVVLLAIYGAVLLIRPGRGGAGPNSRLTVAAYVCLAVVSVIAYEVLLYGCDCLG